MAESALSIHRELVRLTALRARRPPHLPHASPARPPRADGAVAGPAEGPLQHVVAAVSVAALAYRVCPEAETEIAQKALATAGEISDRMALVAG